MCVMSIVNNVILNIVKVGDTVEITPKEKFPNAERRFKVDDICKEGFIYGISEYRDGYVMPFYWIDSLRIL